jgi:hypothetical protein
LEAARIITGLPIFTNTEYIYRETGWERLEERKKGESSNYSMISKNSSTAPYLLELIPLNNPKYDYTVFIPYEMATIYVFYSVDFL